jgi:nitrile hydratase
MTLAPGTPVRVAARPHDGHNRTPAYVKGKTGTVERVRGTFTNPETRAYGGDGLPRQPLYTVGFLQREIWPEYTGRADDRISLDLYEHWLEELR